MLIVLCNIFLLVLVTTDKPSAKSWQFKLLWVHLATATGTPDSSGSNLRLALICRMNAGFRLGVRCNLVALTRCAQLLSPRRFGLDFQT